MNTNTTAIVQPSKHISEEERMEQIRDRFFKTTNLDLKNLTCGEVRDLLELLPAVLVYLHTEFDMVVIFSTDEDGEYTND